jgi:uncharacterized membrane protein
VIRALTLGLLALTLPLAARGLYGPPGALVHIRWQPSVDAAERQRLEIAWQLVDGQEDDSPATWRYDLTAPSVDRLRAIVEHAAVDDTHFIDRQRYTIEAGAIRTARRHGLTTVGGTVIVGLVDRLAMLLAGLAGLSILVRYPMRVVRWLQPHIETARGVAADAWPFRSNTDTPSMYRPGDTLYRLIHVGLAVSLALYPWLYTFQVVGDDRRLWSVWLVAMVAQAISLLVRPAQVQLLRAASLLLILGLCLLHAFIVYERIVLSQLNIDYFVLANWISAASSDPFEHFSNFSPVAGSYVQYYFDPLVPLLNRVLGLTSDPIRLLGFQLVAVLSPAVILWVLAVRHTRLVAFQSLLPTAYLLHPSVIANTQQDYHTSGIGAGFLMVGAFLFFRGGRAAPFALLLLGTLTRLSFWLIWPLLAMMRARDQRWKEAALYAATVTAALMVYRLIQPDDDTRRNFLLTMFAPQVGGTARDVAAYAVLHVGELARVGVQRLQFLLQMGATVGFTFVLFPTGLVPLVPFIAVSLLEHTGLRSVVNHQYAAEYLGLLFAAVLSGLLAAPQRQRAVAAFALGVGMLYSMGNIIAWGEPRAGYESTLRQAYHSVIGARSAYRHEAAFSICATGGKPTIVTLYQAELYTWTTFAREPLRAISIDQVPMGLDFVDAALQRVDDSRWESFETLVYAADTQARSSLARFPTMNGVPHREQYASLMKRLPVEVTTGRGWRYRGADRLAVCAKRFGYAAQTPNR